MAFNFNLISPARAGRAVPGAWATDDDASAFDAQ